MTGTLGSPKSYPTNGYGGSYYHEHFQGVPVYNHGSPATNNIVSWAAIDQYALEAISIIATNGICLGFCLATLVYTVSLTPREKRLKLFHIALLTALLFEIYRLLTVVAPASTPGISSFSSYISITKDVEATTFTNGYRGTLISGWFAGCLSYLFTVACLSLQAKGLLAGLELRYPTWHTVLFCYLLGISAIAFVANVVFNAFQAAHMSGSYQKFPFDILHTLVLALYAASLGSWCLVSLISVTWLVFTRFNMFRGTTHYDTALKIILLTVLDSFIVPLLFCILQAIPYSTGYLQQSEVLVLPTIQILLPLSSLFMSIQSTHTSTTTSERPLHDPNHYSTLLSDHGAETYPLRPMLSHTAPSLPPSTIDNLPTELPPAVLMPSSSSECLEVGHASLDDITKQRAARIRKTLAARNITPVGSRENVREV